MRFLYLLSILFLITINKGISQTNTNTDRDTAFKQKIEISRKQFYDNLPKPNGWVNDFENIFTDQEETQLEKTLGQFEKESSIEISIVTIDTFTCAKADLGDLALHIFEVWNLGKKDKDNGILILFSKGHRTVRMINGGGIDDLTEAGNLQMIIDNYFLPGFKEGQYYAATTKGLTQLINLLKR